MLTGSIRTIEADVDFCNSAMIACWATAKSGLVALLVC